MSVYAMALQDEAQRSMSRLPHVEASDLYSQNQFSAQFGNINNYSKGVNGGQSKNNNLANKNKKNLFCNFCQMTGHTKEPCYKLIGYPVGHKYHKGPAFQGSNWSIKNNLSLPRFAANSVTLNSGGSVSIQESDVATCSVPPQFSPEQVHQILVLLQQASANNEKQVHMAGIACLSSVCFDDKVWIMDSGATDHICHNFDLFLDLTELKNQCKVTLPTGFTVTVTHGGSCVLGSNLVLRNILYIPNFKFNLVSVRRLVLDQHCHVLFDSSKCLIKDPLHKKVLEIGELKGGLYQINNNGTDTTSSGNQLSVANAAVSLEVWHNRLGHLPAPKMTLLLPSIMHTPMNKSLKL